MFDFEADKARRRRLADAARRAAVIRAETEAEEARQAEEAKPHRLTPYLRDPVRFAEDFLPTLPLAPYQKDALGNLVEPDGEGRSAVKGPRGLGKTTVAAVAIVWFAVVHDACRADWKCVITSGSWYQITAYLFPEIRKIVRLLDWEALGLEPWKDEKQLLKTGISLKYGQATSASPERAELIEGAHASAMTLPDGTTRIGAVLVVFDESKAVPESTFDAIEGVFSGVDFKTNFGYALAVSTPGAPAGKFYQIHTRRPGTENWTVRSVSLWEAIRAGRVNIRWAKNLRNLWGRDSPFFHQHVQGRFSADQENAVIPVSWIEAAIERWNARQTFGWAAPPALDLGIDVARQGKDKTMVCIGRGPDHVERFLELNRSDDFTVTATELVQLLSGYGVKPSRISIDADGMGVGLGDILRAQGYQVYFFRGGPRPEGWTDRSGELEAYNTRAAAWWNLRERLDPRFKPTLCLPPDDELIGDLSAPRLVYDLKGRIKIEEKEQTKKRIGRSPDKGDACVYRHFLWVPPQAEPPEEYIPGDDFTGPSGDWTVRPDGPTTGYGGDLYSRG